MDLADLEKYIGNVEARVTKALTDTEKRIGITITSTESRLGKSTDDLDVCISDLKREVNKVKTTQITCAGHKSISDFNLEFRNHKDGHVTTKQMNDLEASLRNHTDGHRKVKEYQELGITKFRVYAFIFFAFAGMVISIWSAFF